MTSLYHFLITYQLILYFFEVNVYHKAKTPCIAFSVDKKSINLSIHCDRGLTFYTDRSVLRATAIFLAKKLAIEEFNNYFWDLSTHTNNYL